MWMMSEDVETGTETYMSAYKDAEISNETLPISEDAKPTEKCKY